MRKTFSISDLDCIVCSNALEKKLNTIAGVKTATVNFFLRQMTLEAEDGQFDDALKRVWRAVDHSVPGAELSE